jgi:hypothetical protein
VRNYCVSMLCIVGGLLLVCPREVGAWASVGDYTHDKLTDDAINEIPAADYPDLRRFTEKLRDGSETEESHNILNDAINGQLWAGDPETWWNDTESASRKGVLPWYKEYNFGNAYNILGYMLHLYQDQDVPAHITFCLHGYWMGPVLKIDDLENYAWQAANYRHDASTFASPWTFTDNKGYTWSYWLDDSMDDDDGDNLNPDPSDENDAAGNPIDDGLDLFYRGRHDWGTYGYGDYVFSLDTVPGKDEGYDYFTEKPNANIANEQLTKSYVLTLDQMKARSNALPPLIPDDATHGQPSISATIFGPNKPVDVSFVAMENRKKTVLVSILAGTSAIKAVSGTVLDGGATSGYDLVSDPSLTALPWHGTISVSWKGDLGTGELVDGNYTVKMKVKDHDGHDSEERTRPVKYDKTKPTGTIAVSVLP